MCVSLTSVEILFVIYSGLLESVSNLTVTLINSTTVLISWSPPFTLEGVPILGYNVTITSATNVASVTVNNTSLYYQCHESSMNITVVAVNGAGDGYPATFSEIICPSPSRKSNYFLSEDTCIHYINMRVHVKHFQQ